MDNLNSTDLIEYHRDKKPFTTFRTLNLLNTTIMNTRYGIMDKILPYSVYVVQVNASNMKGYVLSGEVEVSTLKSIPEGIIAPQKVYATANTMQIEWYEPMLANSADVMFYFEVFLWVNDLLFSLNYL